MMIIAFSVKGRLVEANNLSILQQAASKPVGFDNPPF